MIKKEHTHIKNKMIKRLELYRKRPNFIFHDDSENALSTDIYKLDHNDTEVVLLKFNDSEEVLITTKCLFINKNNTITRIDGKDIKSYHYVNMLDKRNFIWDKKKFPTHAEYKIWMLSGQYNIVMFDDTSIDVFLPDQYFGACLSNAIKMLQFYPTHYIYI